MSIITLTTVGYQEVHPLTDAGRYFVVVFLVFGLGVSAYSVTQLGEMIVKAEFFRWAAHKRKGNMMKSLSDHYVVCGYGRMGQNLCQNLRSHGISVVVIDMELSDTDLEELSKLGILYVIGDATDDSTLVAANLHKAKGLASVVKSDAQNLFVVLSARILCPDLQIIARASDERNRSKLLKAGANRVVSPYAAGASKMAQMLTHPHLSEIFDWASAADDNTLEIAELKVEPDWGCANRKLVDTNFAANHVVVVAIRRQSGALDVPPQAESLIQPGDRLVVVGTKSRVEALIREPGI